MANGQAGSGGGYVPIVGKEAASDPNAVYITANVPEPKPQREDRRCTKEFHLTIDSTVQQRLVGERWDPIPRDEVQPFIFPSPLPNLERVEAGCFYYLYIRPNPAYNGTNQVRAVVTFTVSNERGEYATTGTYVHKLPRRSYS